MLTIWVSYGRFAIHHTRTSVVQIDLERPDEVLYLEQVISVKAVAIALKLSFNGVNQFVYIQTWFFISVVIICCLVQLNYLNKVSSPVIFGQLKYTAMHMNCITSGPKLQFSAKNMIWNCQCSCH